ncbi:MAG: single-stranded-DNA-specific exonuclease RecJ, partial [Cyanobacteriota bacterium]
MLPLPSEQRWQCPAPVQIDPQLRSSGLCDPLLAVLQRRGYSNSAAIEALLNPAPAPDPRRHFPDLGKAVQRLRQACKQGERLAICGDYDADGMTSTAL